MKEKVLIFETNQGDKELIRKDGSLYIGADLKRKNKAIVVKGVKSPAEDRVYTLEEIFRNPELAVGKYLVVYSRLEGKEKFLYWTPGSGDDLTLKDWEPHKIVNAYLKEIEIEEEEVSEEITNLKDTYIDIRGEGEIYVWKTLTPKEIEKRVQEAIEKYKKRTGKKEGFIFDGKLKLPRVILNNQEIDLDELYKDAETICELIGLVPYICYIDQKDGFKVKYIHFPEGEVYLVADTTDPTRIFLIHGLKLTERGLEG